MNHHRGGWEYALVGHSTLARARGGFGTTGTNRLTSRVHVSPRDWEGSVSSSVRARCPAVTPAVGHLGAAPRCSPSLFYLQLGGLGRATDQAIFLRIASRILLHMGSDEFRVMKKNGQGSAADFAGQGRVQEKPSEQALSCGAAADLGVRGWGCG